MWDPILAAWKAIEMSALHRDREQDPHRALSLHRAPLPDAAKLAAGRGLAFFPSRPSSRHALGARRLLPIVGALGGAMAKPLRGHSRRRIGTGGGGTAGDVSLGRCRRARHQDRAPGGRFRAPLRDRAAQGHSALISSGSTAARNRWFSTSKKRRRIARSGGASSRAPRCLRAKSQSGARRPAPVSRPRSCGGGFPRPSSPARSRWAMARTGLYRDMKAYDLHDPG